MVSNLQVPSRSCTTRKYEDANYRYLFLPLYNNSPLLSVTYPQVDVEVPVAEDVEVRRAAHLADARDAHVDRPLDAALRAFGQMNRYNQDLLSLRQVHTSPEKREREGTAYPVSEQLGHSEQVVRVRHVFDGEHDGHFDVQRRQHRDGHLLVLWGRQ